MEESLFAAAEDEAEAAAEVAELAAPELREVPVLVADAPPAANADEEYSAVAFRVPHFSLLVQTC